MGQWRRYTVRSFAWLLLLAGTGLAGAEPAVVLKLDSAVLLGQGQEEKFTTQPDTFGPGLNALTAHANPSSPWRTQVRFGLEGVPEGEYTPGLLVLTPVYMNEFAPNQVRIYHNDHPLPWTGYSIPTRPDDAAEKSTYQTELHAARIVYKPGDTLRLVVSNTLTVGPVRLYATPPTGDIELYHDAGHWARYGESDWLLFGWAEKKREADRVVQSCWFHNPGALPHEFRLTVEARDYWQRPLLDSRETILLPPGARIERSYQVATGDSGRVRLALTATSDEFHPAIYSARFFVTDRTAPPRPRLSLNGEWQMCYAPAPGVELGPTPDAAAAWTSVVVPSLQSPGKLHCAWYRKSFTPPPYLGGERYVLKFEQVLSEARIYLNGKEVHYQFSGAHPFEADATAAFRPGQPNELLIGVRDWLAYSPRNQERARAGEEPIIKDGMRAPAGYIAMGCWGGSLGIGRPVWLEARPAVAVENLGVLTSVREKTLTARYVLANHTAADQDALVSPTVLDADKVVKALKPRRVRVPAGKQVEVEFVEAWRNPRLWEPGDPHLYTLQTEVQPTASAADLHRQRFGFREIWIDGYRFMVNGRPMNIRSKWVSRVSSMPQDTDIEKRLETLWGYQMGDVHNNDLQLTRTHNQVGVEELCDIADESGLMIKVENGNVCQQNFSFTKEFWQNTSASEVDMVKAYRDHASVFMWSAGNENWLWNWVYQGEAARVQGHKLTVAVCQEIDRADYMHRPIEWESDGDLAGDWNYHALHYSRELASAPYLPNAVWWGPLDGKTVVPYHLSPITLGTKPITSGETFCPGGQPHVQSLLLGDSAYLGGSYQWRGWVEAARFLVNGMRDVEMALLDTYVTMSFQKPQSVVLKEETTALFGGQTLTRSLNVHNDVPQPAKLLLRWRLTAADPARPLDSGQVRLKLGPAELSRQSLRVKLPRVDKVLPAEFSVELLDGERVLHRETRQWQIHPALALRAPASLRLAVYDPEGQTAELLTGLGLRFERLATLQAPATGGALLLGRNALHQAPQGSWREGVAAFVRGGGKLVVLEPSDAPDFLPTPLALAQGTRTTIAFARAADHPLLAGLTDTDLRWWAPDHLVSTNNCRKPVNGNYVPVVDMGTTDGMLDAAILEEYDGKGSYLLCQMPLTDKARTAPPAARMLQNLLDYLAAPATYRTPAATAVLAAANSSLRRALEQSRLVYDDFSGNPAALTPQDHALAIVDAASALDEKLVPVLRTYATAGGRVLIHGATPERAALLESLVGLRLRFEPVSKEPTDVHNRVLRRTAPTGVLGGLSNYDLFWATNAYLAKMNDNGKWWGAFEPLQPEELIADFYCRPGDADAARATQWTRPCALLEVPLGAGQVLVSQLRLDQPVAETAATVSRLRAILLTNLGATLRGTGAGSLTREQRLRTYSFFQVDLGPYANRGLRDDKAAGIVGWTNQQDNDMRALPTGRQTLAGVPFLIATPKSVVALYSEAGGNTDLPREVTGIAVGARADLLFFLHCFAYNAGDCAFRYRVNYADGTSVEVPIRTGCQAIDWWTDPGPLLEVLALNSTVVAFRGDNPMRQGVTLLCCEWVNPSPEKEIRSLDFLSVPGGPVALLVGVSAATCQASEGVVEDVLGTAGVRVRLGTLLADIHYIGVVGLAAGHPYYETAVREHKALVLGKKVAIVSDVVTQSGTGERIAYVYVAGSMDIQNLLNAQVLASGLGTLGNFEGNNRHRDYLNNLGFIATQNRKGIWSMEKK